MRSRQGRPCPPAQPGRSARGPRVWGRQVVMPRLSPRPVNLFLTSSRRSPSPIPPLASKRDNSILHRPPRTPPRNNHGPISVCRETPPVLPALAFASQRTQDPATNRIGHHPAAETASHLASIAATASQQQQQRTPEPAQSERQDQQHKANASSIRKQGLRTQSLALEPNCRLRYLPNSAPLPSVGRCCLLLAVRQRAVHCRFTGRPQPSRRDRPARCPPSSDHLGGVSPARKGARNLPSAEPALAERQPEPPTS